MIKPKFSVGDVLKLVLDDTGLVKLHVVEIKTITCPSKIAQVQYGCRVHTQHYKKSPPAITRNLFDFNEIEVENFKEAQE